MSTSFNLCNLPPWAIASRHFCDNPQPIEIQGVRPTNRFLFDLLDRIDAPEERAVRFDAYLSVKFQLHQVAGAGDAGRAAEPQERLPPRGPGASTTSLLYAFTQYELARRQPGERWVTLWRGVHDADEHEVLSRAGPRDLVVRANNLSSFTDDRERAWEFGTTVWEARIPLPRVFFAGALLPASILKGEREWLVVGGELPVKLLR
jgi:NAD+--dinitrogen-reductase ADP-D-ribosyltransferase